MFLFLIPKTSFPLQPPGCALDHFPDSTLPERLFDQPGPFRVVLHRPNGLRDACGREFGQRFPAFRRRARSIALVACGGHFEALNPHLNAGGCAT